MKVLDSILGAIGNTPLIRLRKIGGKRAEIFAKAEFMNPAGSSKDRTALGIIEDAEERGELEPGGLVVEATSGNTGVALSMIAAAKGYRCIIVMPEENRGPKTDIMEAYGAEVVYTKPGADWNGPDGPLGTAERIVKENAGAFYANQFRNPANPQIHARTTAREIFEQMGGRLDILIAGIGTSGTIVGAAGYLKEKLPGLRAVGVAAEGSAFSPKTGTGGYIEGITPDFIPEIYREDLVDEVVAVSFGEALRYVKDLLRLEGIPAGISSGAAVSIAVREAEKHPGKRIVVVLPDTVRNYPLRSLLEKAKM